MSLFQHVKAQWAADLKAGQNVETLFRVLEINRRLKKDGSPFLTMTLMDRTGKMDAKLWDGVAAAESAVVPGAIHTVSGTVKEYRGRLELHLQRIRALPRENSGIDEKDFVEAADFDVDNRFDSMIRFIDKGLNRRELHPLLEAFVDAHGREFRRHYGAQKIHHAKVGGLLEHTDSMVRLAAQVADHYSLDRDILVLGALLHDLGKLREFTTEPALQATTEGGLLGHIVISLEMFDDLCRQAPDIPPEIRLHLRHLIVSHHGEREFGSPEVPRTLEAMALHAIDLLDSKLAIFMEAASQSAADRGFTDYVPSIARRVLIQAPPDREDE